jgi:hypothetical protein
MKNTHICVPKLPLLVDLQLKVGESLLSVRHCPSISRKDVAMVTLSIGIIFLLLTSMHFWVWEALFIFWKGFRNATIDPKFCRRGVVLVMPCQGEKCSGTPFQLPSFWERTSGTVFWHIPSQNYPWVCGILRRWSACASTAYESGPWLSKVW